MSISIVKAMEGLTLKPKGGSKLRIAIDFGTTHSAIAWTYTGNPRGQKDNVIQEWPGKVGIHPKVPTTLKYNPEGTNPPYKWGFQIKDDEKRHEWFKLGLEPDLAHTGLAETYPSSTALPPVYGAACEKLIVDYLTALRLHALDYLRKRFGVGDAFFTTIEYIITVPAMWSEKAQNTTKVCAERAGMGDWENIEIVSEPEAAGVYALESMVGLSLEKDDTFVICDAGGGTVDLVTYTVDSLHPTISLSEEVPGKGELCGSIFLNRIFAKFLSEKFKRYQPKWDEDSQSVAMERFETDIKRDFDSDPDVDKYIIPAWGFGNNRPPGVEKNKLLLSRDTMQKIFEPVITKILPLVQAQIDASEKTVKAVLLAGGFGPNVYLKKRIQESVDPGIDVRPIDNSETAIVRGALSKAVVKSRKARKHYGAPRFIKFKAGEHDIRKRDEIKNPLTGDYEIDVFDWLVKKGSILKDKKPYPCGKGFYFEKKVDDWNQGFQIPITIYTCDDPEPPQYLKGATGVNKLVNLTADLGAIDTKDLPTQRGTDGSWYYKVDFDIEMVRNSASMTWILVHGKGNKRREYPKTIVEEFI